MADAHPEITKKSRKNLKKFLVCKINKHFWIRLTKCLVKTNSILF